MGVNDISKTGGMTRNGHCYLANFLGVGKRDEKGIEKVSTEVADMRKKKKVTQTIENNVYITEAKAYEFLKFIKHNKYNVVDQLSKMLARISLLLLLQNSEPYYEALIKVLN